jgi:hypothetical protein
MGATPFTFLLGDPWPSVGHGKSTLDCRDVTDLGAAGWRNVVCAFLISTEVGGALGSRWVLTWTTSYQSRI